MRRGVAALVHQGCGVATRDGRAAARGDEAAVEGRARAGAVVHSMLDALQARGVETGCGVSSFIVPIDGADCICAGCGTVVYEGPESANEAQCASSR